MTGYTGENTFAGVLNRLKGFTALTNLVPANRIFGNVNQQSTFPYVSMHYSSESFDDKTETGMMYRFTIKSYSRESSQKESAKIIEQIYNALHRQESNITIAGSNLIICQMTGQSDIFKDNDGVTWDGVIEFEILVK